MDKKLIMQALSEQKAMLEKMGYKVAYIGLYGSQNYGLDLYTDNYQSDIDTKAIVIPSLDDLVNNSKPISTKVESSTGEIDVKNIRVFMETLLKANPAYLEVLFTDYFIMDNDFKLEMQEMLDKREDLVYVLRGQMLRAIYGMMLEKQKALCHPYPTIAWKIEKWKFDGKQSSHCIRLCEMAIAYFAKNLKYQNCLKVSDSMKSYILNHKLNKVTLEEAERDCKQSIEYIKSLKDSEFKELDEFSIDYSIRDDYIKISKRIIKLKIMDDILADYKSKIEESK